MTTIDSKFIREASKELHDQIKKDVNKQGYNLSYGYTFLEEGKPQIFMRPQYTSLLRYLNMFGSKRKQAKIAEIIPEEFIYKDVKIPVELKFVSISKFL